MSTSKSLWASSTREDHETRRRTAGEIIVKTEHLVFLRRFCCKPQWWPSGSHRYVMQLQGIKPHMPLLSPSDRKGVVYALEERQPQSESVEDHVWKGYRESEEDSYSSDSRRFPRLRPRFPSVTGMIVDQVAVGRAFFRPSYRRCKFPRAGTKEIDTERLNKLAGFQFKIMKHALSFPKVHKVCVFDMFYSSAHENERVVVDLLSDAKFRNRAGNLKKRQFVIPSWDRRGLGTEFSSLCDGDKGECWKWPADVCAFCAQKKMAELVLPLALSDSSKDQ